MAKLVGSPASLSETVVKASHDYTAALPLVTIWIGYSGLWRQKQKSPAEAELFMFPTGAGEEIRTLDPNLGKVVLYH